MKVASRHAPRKQSNVGATKRTETVHAGRAASRSPPGAGATMLEAGLTDDLSAKRPGRNRTLSHLHWSRERVRAPCSVCIRRGPSAHPVHEARRPPARTQRARRNPRCGPGFGPIHNAGRRERLSGFPGCRGAVQRRDGAERSPQRPRRNCPAQHRNTAVPSACSGRGNREAR